MRPEQWEAYKRAARLEPQDQVPMAMIVDSPWIPGYVGVGHMDYYLNPEVWFEANMKVIRDFPDVIMVPSWWMEYGMAAEPSILGAKIKFWRTTRRASTTRSTAWPTSTSSRSTRSRPTRSPR